MQNLANFVSEKTEIKNELKEQIFANELRHHYKLRNPKGHKPTMVFLVVRINKEQVKISIGMKVYPIHWNVNRAKEGIGIPFLENNNNRLQNERLMLFDNRTLNPTAIINIAIAMTARINFIYKFSICKNLYIMFCKTFLIFNDHL